MLKNCDEPLQVVQRLGYRPGIYLDLRIRNSLLVGGKSTAANDYAGQRIYRNSFCDRSEVVIEEWACNFDPHKFMRKVTFENGAFVDVDTLGRGFR